MSFGESAWESGRRALAGGVLFAGVAGCGAPYFRVDLARGGIVADRKGARAQVSIDDVEVGGPRAPSPQAVTFAALHTVEFLDKGVRFGIANQARFYAYRWLAPCVGSPSCDITITGPKVDKDGPFHTVIRGKRGKPVDAEYIGKNTLEEATVGAFLEGDLLVTAFDGRVALPDGVKAGFNLERPRALAGLFATASPPLIWGLLRFGVEGGGQYDGAELGWFGRLWMGVGVTVMPSPRRVQDVPPPYVPGK